MRGIGEQIHRLSGLQGVAGFSQDVHIATQCFGAAGNIDDTLGRGVTALQ